MPLNPFFGVIVIVAVPGVPLLKVRDETLGLTVTSGVVADVTVTCTVAVWTNEP
jgi:hypothetical protein